MECKPTSPSSALAMRKESRLVAKLQPQIRIVHIFAPEIIKTDAANFRELVQRLTGKPVQRRRSNSSKKKRKLAAAAAVIPTTPSDVSGESEGSEAAYTFNRGDGHGDGLLLELERGPRDDRELVGLCERVKEEEEEMWGGEHSGFFSGFGDLDGFIQGLSEFPVLAPLASSHLDVFGEAHLS
ncbi:hypothetical protein ACLOJK_017469 [Asimina triloba]